MISGMEPVPRRAVVVTLAAALMVLASLALRADVALSGRWSWIVVGDLAVGLAFPLAALVARGPLAQRVLVALVGLTWLAGSIWPWAIALHQGAAIAMLGAYPSGRLRRPVPLIVAAAGIAIAITIPGPLVAGTALAAESVLLLALDLIGPLRQRGYAVVSSLVLATTLVHAYWLSAQGRTGEPGLYQVAMLAVAAGYPVATRLSANRSRDLRDRLVAGEATGLQQLASVLADLLRDPSLTIVEPSDGGQPHPASSDERPVELDGTVAATVRSASPLLADPNLGQAVDDSVRLIVRHERLRAADEARSRELELSRRRLLVAVDRERADAAAQLAERVGEPVAAALSRLTSTQAGPLATVAESLREVDAEIAAIVRGTLPADLAGAGLAGTIEALARQSPVPVTVRIGTVHLDAEAATALFYVCREALANVAKHADATTVAIELDHADSGIRLTVTDDGRGGADPAGSGLTGLSDRVVAIGAVFTVVSLPGTGTRIEVWVPR
jgi:signal transduction histidine kinase